MLKKHLILPSLLLLITLIVASLYITTSAFSLANHVVISEIQSTGGVGATNDEFVELYNPTGSAVDLTGWKLTKKPADGDPETNLVDSFPSISIPAHSYVLIAHDDYDGSVAEDITYSDSVIIANDNTISLYDQDSNPVDKVGMGTATDVETTATSNPAANASIERKATSGSTSESMGSGGSEETLGNGEDSDDNSQDFVTRESSDPQNSSSAIEVPTDASPSSSPSPTEGASPSPSPEEEMSPSPSPTESPSPSPSPTESPSPSPSETESPSPEPSMSPTPKPSPTPLVLGEFKFFGRKITCSLVWRLTRIGFINVFFPQISCVKLL